MIRRQCLLCDHVADENDKDVIGQIPGVQPQLSHLFRPIVAGRIREKILGLPAVLNSFEKRAEILGNESLHAFDDLEF